MTRRTKLILLGMTGALLALGTFFATAIYQTTHVVVPNAYAVWWTADLVIEHMERNQGAWPRNWDELRLTSQQADRGTTSTNRDGTRIAEFRPRASIEELQQRVEIDWSARPEVLAKAHSDGREPPFRAIWLRNGKGTHYSGKEPNQMILDYLRSMATPPTRPGGGQP